MLDWQPISSAPFDRDLQLSVIEKEEVYALIFPCRPEKCPDRAIEIASATAVSFDKQEPGSPDDWKKISPDQVIERKSSRHVVDCSV